MNSLRSIKLSALVFISAVLLAGCSNPDLIITDTTGKPIAGAKIVGSSLSIGGQSSASDRKGHAKIPWAVQETKWISVSKEGFRPVENIDAAQKKPIVVKMTKTNG
jgi:hypothetical protein